MGTFVKRGRELENQTRKTFVDKSINVRKESVGYEGIN